MNSSGICVVWYDDVVEAGCAQHLIIGRAHKGALGVRFTCVAEGNGMVGVLDLAAHSLRSLERRHALGVSAA
jgi:hypothetical protein